MPSRDHLDAFMDAMHRRDAAGTAAHMADDAVINSPILPEPVKGKERIVELLGAMLGIVDSFEMKKLIGANRDYVAVLAITAGSTTVGGMDHMHLNEDGFVDGMTVAWRPLAEMVEIQKKLAAAVGMQAMTLVPLIEDPSVR